jgi:hypothetical protein
MIFYFMIGLVLGIIYFVGQYQGARRFQPWINYHMNKLTKRRIFKMLVRSVGICLLWPAVLIGVIIKNVYLASKTSL